jgi:hypothetical protein
VLPFTQTRSDAIVDDVDIAALHRRHRSALIRSIMFAGATEEEANT